MNIFLGVAKILNIFMGMPEIPDVFGKPKMLGPNLRIKKNESTSPLGL